MQKKVIKCCSLKGYNEAIDYYNKAFRFGNHYYYNRQRGTAYYFQKDYEKAIADFNISLESRPYSLSTLNYRGNSHRKLSDCKKALIDYELILTIDPEYKKVKKKIDYCHR